MSSLSSLSSYSVVASEMWCSKERNEQISKGLKDGTLEKGVYRGLGGYKQLGSIFQWVKHFEGREYDHGLHLL